MNSKSLLFSSHLFLHQKCTKYYQFSSIFIFKQLSFLTVFAEDVNVWNGGTPGLVCVPI